LENLFNNGSYSIVFSLRQKIEIFLPKFGIQKFDKGLYVYSGSGKKNLLARIERHLRKKKKFKWHIDYFSSRKEVEPVEIFLFKDKTECEINLFFKEIGGVILIPDFGSTDCKNKCGSHFLFLEKLPERNDVLNFGGIDGKLCLLQNSK
jgi:sugar fermentation stimulation protein A